MDEPTEKRLQRLEKTVDAIKFYLVLLYRNTERLVDKVREPHPNLDPIERGLEENLASLETLHDLCKK